MGNDLNGAFANSGTISGGDYGVRVLNDLNGAFTNSGTISDEMFAGVGVANNLNGSFTNSGTISGLGMGVWVVNDLNGAFTNSGTISGRDIAGVRVDNDLNGAFTNSGTISGGMFAGVWVDNDLNGAFTNSGTISGEAFGIRVNNDLNGVFTNSGTIEGIGFSGFGVIGDLNGAVTNSGTIRGQGDGFLVLSDLNGTFTNSGTVEGSIFGIRAGNTSGTIRNQGGRVIGTNAAIQLGGMDGTMVLSGPSHIDGIIDGGAGTDVLRFENIRGITAAKQAELAALAAANPAAGTVTLFGETISWQNFENIQANVASLVSYQSLVSDPGLLSYANALDNVTGLQDDFRQFLSALNNVDVDLLERALSNASGQTVMNAINDIAREQDTTFFNLFSSQFSSLRGNVSGSLASNQSSGVQRSGLFTQDVQVGMAVAAPNDQVDTWVSSYVGNGRQDANGSRAEADYDSTSFLFGRGAEVSENWYLGGFGGYTRSEGQIDGFGSYIQNNGGWVGANAQFQSGDVFANFVGAFGFQDMKSIRRDIVGNRIQGDTDSLGGLFFTQVGRDFFFGEDGDTRVSPYAGLTLSAQAIDAFTEQGPASTSLRFADQTVTTFQTVLGVAVTEYRDTERGWLRLRADLAWWRAYGGEETYSAGLVAPGLLNGFNVTSPGANENRGVVQLGIEFGSDRLENWIFQAGYFGVFGDNDYASHGGTFGARVRF